MTSIPDVSWSRVAAFVRQHTHDLRNDLNGLDLEAALLADIVTDPEGAESLARMRAEVRKIAAHLRLLSGKFADARPTLLRLPAQELFLIWQDQLAELPAPPKVEWASELGDGEVNIDPAGVAGAFREILVNAKAFGHGETLRAKAASEGKNAVFELREPKAEAVDPGKWGAAPFFTTRRGGYGLGLCDVLRTVRASGGTITWKFDAKECELVTSFRFPFEE